MDESTPVVGGPSLTSGSPSVVVTDDVVYPVRGEEGELINPWDDQMITLVIGGSSRKSVKVLPNIRRDRDEETSGDEADGSDFVERELT
jgi:hypothetical protein